ncbi:hypothetical protein AB0F52_33560 [Amycolatopsis sp. NPDC024027]|uniref:hypothetical protein n=1 Tax=Amycolatopsis sp. NPDC024027 TaxID=3154327 RepID=UPI0033DE474E
MAAVDGPAVQAEEFRPGSEGLPDDSPDVRCGGTTAIPDCGPRSRRLRECLLVANLPCVLGHADFEALAGAACGAFANVSPPAAVRAQAAERLRCANA